MEIKKAVYYGRKSTNNKDKQQLSLTTQNEWLKEYLLRNPEITITEFVSMPEKASETGRKGFAEVLGYIDQGIEILVCMHFDRIARNSIDFAEIQWRLQNGKLKKIITSDKVFGPEDAGILFGMFQGMAIEDVIKIKKGVKNGMKTKIELGGFLGRAKIGYLNDKENKTIIKDPERRFYIPRIYQLRLEGLSFEAIADQMYKEGFRTRKSKKTPIPKRVAKSVIAEILSNPVYCGWIRYAGEMFDKGYMYKGNHEPIITKELFDKVQQINRGVVYVKDREISFLKGKIFHKETNTPMCISYAKKDKYIYAHLHSRKGNLYYNHEKIIKYFDRTIKYYRIPDSFRPEVKKLLYETYNGEYEKNIKKIDSLNRSRVEKQKTLDGLILMRANQEITGDQFVKMQNEYSSDIEKITGQIKKLEGKNTEILIDFNKMVELLFNCIDEWKTYSMKKKSYLISLMMVELKISTKKELYIKEKPLFRALNMLNRTKWSHGSDLNR